MSYQYLYWIVFGALIFGLFLDRNILNQKTKFLAFIPLLILLSLVVALTIDQFDIDVYRSIYTRLLYPPETWKIDMFPEYGFQLINYLFHGILGLSFEYFRFFFSLLSLLILYFTVSKLTNQQGAFFLLYYPKYFLIGMISHVRSGFVNPFLFLSISLATKRKYSHIFLLSLVLSQIHLSAILLNITSILSFFKLRAIYIVTVIPLALCFLYFAYPSFSALLTTIELRQSGYFEATENRYLFGIEFIRRVALLALCFYTVKYGSIRSLEDDLIIKVFLASIFIYIGFFEAKFIADRIGGMLGFVEPLVLLVFIKNNNLLSNKIFSYGVVIIYTLLDFLIRALALATLPGHLPLGLI